MKDEDKTKEQLISELVELRQRVVDVQGRLRLLEAKEAEWVQAKEALRESERRLKTLFDTERKQAEEALRESEERYRAIFEQAADPIVLIDPKTVELIEFNNKAYENLGYTREEFGKLKISDLDVIESTEEVAKHAEKVIKEGADSFETKKRTKGGEVRDILVSTKAISFRGRDFIQSIWYDITERKRAEEALRESDEKYRQLFATVSDAVMIFDAETRQFVDVNDAALHLYGYSKDEFLGLKHEDITAEPEMSDDSIRQTLAGELTRIPLRHHRKKDGTIFPVEISASTLSIGNRKMLCGVVREITERVQAEEALRESERRFRELLENVQLIAVTLDVQGNVTFCNDFLLGLTGWQRDDIVGKSWFDHFLPSDVGTEVKSIFLATIQSGTIPPHYENAIQTREGEQRLIAWNNTMLRDLRGNVVGTASIGEDITERNRATEALRWERDLVARIMDTSPVGISVVDQEGQITFANPHAQRVLGLTKDEITQRTYNAPEWHITDFNGDPFPDEELPFRQVMDTGRSVKDVRHAIQWPDGRKVLLSINAAPLFDELNQVNGMVATIEDITERVQVEKRLKKYSERLEEMVEERTRELGEAQEQLVRQEKIAMLGQLAGGVAHELRNPLAAINNAAYFLNLVLEDPTPEVKSALGVLEQEVQTSDRIIRSLLDLAYGKPPVKAQVDLNYIIQDALSSITIPENVEVTVQLDEALPDILADSTQLRQVFGNIALNAVQAMSLPGAERSSGRLVVKSEALGSEWVAVSFADTGVGIAEENLEQLFEPFFTTKAKGIGLGLAISKNLVEANGGSIEVQSKAGEGSTFTVKLPVIGD